MPASVTHIGMQLLESLLWEPRVGYFLLPRHVERMTRSAQALGFAHDVGTIVAALLEYTDVLREAGAPQKVRALLHRDGRLTLGAEAVKPSTPVRAALAPDPIDAADPRVLHKTTDRTPYEQALAAVRPLGAADAILRNARGEITETCMANLVLDIDGRRLTPALGCGLLAGTFRAELLAQGEIEEAVLTEADLRRARALWLVNSVRRWCAIELVPAPDCAPS